MDRLFTTVGEKNIKTAAIFFRLSLVLVVPFFVSMWCIFTHFELELQSVLVDFSSIFTLKQINRPIKLIL